MGSAGRDADDGAETGDDEHGLLLGLEDAGADVQGVVDDVAICDRDAADGAVGIAGILDNPNVPRGQSDAPPVSDPAEHLDEVTGEANLMPAVVAEPGEQLNVSHGILLY